MAEEERSGGELAHPSNVKVKIEKEDPVEVTLPSLPWRAMCLPTDLTPFQPGDGISSPIDLSDTESESVLETMMDDVTRLNCRIAPSKSLKRKCPMIDLDSIIDLEEEDLDYHAKKSESGEKPPGLLKRQFKPEVKLDSEVHQYGPIADLQVISGEQMEDLAKASDQQYVFDIAHDMDDATMEELMRDDEEDPDFMLDVNGHVDQDFAVSTFDADCEQLVPNPKGYQGEVVPPWYLAQAGGNEEPSGQPSSGNSQHLSCLNTGCSKGFEQGSRYEPSSQTASLRQNSGQLVTNGGTRNAQPGQLPVQKAAPNDLELSLSSATAEAVEALRRFVEASSARGAFQPPQVSMASHVTPPEVAEMSRMDSIAPPSVVRDAIPTYEGTILVPKPEPEPVDVDMRKVGTSNPVETQCNAVRPGLQSRENVIKALRMFEQGRIQMLQEQFAADPHGKRGRSDLKVACSLRKNGMWQNEHRPIGECPGVEVGDCFTYRIEMAIVGLHRQVQAGIAVVSSLYCPYGKPVAASVVIGGNDTYKDDKDMGETVIYSGQGGLAADKSGIYQDQKLLRGNLALANSFELGLPVRLIRGHKLQGTNTGTLYSYDGLYKVLRMAYDVGVHGNKVFTFQLQRIPGQPPIHPPSMAALLYPASVVRYPLPLNSHYSLPASSKIPPSQEQPWIEQTTSSQGTNQPSTPRNYLAPRTPYYVDGCWTGAYEEKPLLYLLPQ